MVLRKLTNLSLLRKSKELLTSVKLSLALTALTYSANAQVIQYYNNFADTSHVISPINSVDGNANSYSTVMANSGAIFGIASYSGYIELESSTTIPANKTTYVRLETEDPILGSLLGGSLGGDFLENSTTSL